MLEKRVYVRTADGHFFTARFAGRDHHRNLIINGQPIHPLILELFVSIMHRDHPQKKPSDPSFLGGTLRSSIDNAPYLNPNYLSTDLGYLYRYDPHLDWN